VPKAIVSTGHEIVTLVAATHFLLTYLLTYLLAYFLTYLLTCLLSYLLTYFLTYLLAYLLTYLFTYLLTHSLIPWSRFLLEKLNGLQLVTKFPPF
jgi:predicted PurR-regulated permease PerM